MPTQNGVVTVGNNETTHLLPNSLLGGFTKPSESRISETTLTSDYKFSNTIFRDVSNICVTVLENMNRDPTSRLNSTAAAIICKGQNQRITISLQCKQSKTA